MQRVYEYRLVNAPLENGSFEEEVNWLIRMGWQPLGGVQRSWHELAIGTQALVRYGEIDELAAVLGEPQPSRSTRSGRRSSR